MAQKTAGSSCLPCARLTSLLIDTSCASRCCASFCRSSPQLCAKDGRRPAPRRRATARPTASWRKRLDIVRRLPSSSNSSAVLPQVAPSRDSAAEKRRKRARPSFLKPSRARRSRSRSVAAAAAIAAMPTSTESACMTSRVGMRRASASTGALASKARRNAASSRKSTMRGSTPPASVTPPKATKATAMSPAKRATMRQNSLEALRLLAGAIGQRRGDQRRPVERRLRPAERGHARRMHAHQAGTGDDAFGGHAAVRPARDAATSPPPRRRPGRSRCGTPPRRAAYGVRPPRSGRRRRGRCRARE